MKFKETKVEENLEPAKDSKVEEPVIERKRVCTLSDKMQELLLRQLSHELQNHNIYRTFANFFGTQGLNVLEEYYIQRAEEEKHHHDWIANYLNSCDAVYTYPEIPKVDYDLTDNIVPFQLTVDKEIETTKLIYEMVDQAFEEKDWITWKWLMGDDDKLGRLVVEQLEEETISRTTLDIASAKEGSWLRKEKSIMDAYKGDTD